MSLFLSSVTKASGCKNILLSTNQHLVVKQTIISSSSPLSSMTSSFSSSITNTAPPKVTQVKQEQPTRRRRKRRITGVDGNVPSYKEFVHKFTVVTLYRDFLKAVNLMPHNRQELANQVKMEFRANQLLDINDTFQVQRALTDGKRRFQELQEMTGYKKQLDADSWLNIQDEQDPRGRVGEGWPWNK
mmetsp:Transcript_43828/g.105724  ORF Transcript_43828/g.105724 Transcript_43828/m.105724 type:complete len:187 (+) Transcript_43828:50-610(+)